MAASNISQVQFEELIRGQMPVLVDFWAPWCGYCRRIGPVYDRVARDYAGRVITAKLNIDDHPGLAGAEQIEVIPTLVLYKDGKAVDSIVAPESKAAIDAFLRSALER